ncbi:hypothetical protein QLT00_gp65 [Gordonia phage Commandaria]|uniref:Uncharacterized protein n=1 Tax=Gordonia phage Commandaria TaxID=3038364 RepID=A0AAF0GGB8_9CAUD|nr:hypothetical protein QLT00_gp65 [Gordonia phage Commandaria]WGH20848.1 hypothetical protein [Gordonia phage Commandaria]
MATKLKLKLGAEAAKVEASTGFQNYTGPTPPAGVYSAKIKQIGMKATRAGDKTMLVSIIELDAPKGHPNAEYNGYAIFHRLVIPESMEEEYIDLKVGQINRLLDAVSGDDKLRTVFWGGNAVVDDKGEKILKIGKFSLAGKGFKGISVVVSTKNDSYTKKEKGADGKIVKKTTRQLRINDIHPAGHEVPTRGDAVVDEEVEDADDIVLDDEDAIEADDVVEADDDDDVVESDDDDAEDVDADGEVYVDEDGDEDGYVSEDEDDSEPEPEPEQEPEPVKASAGRKRRSAF